MCIALHEHQSEVEDLMAVRFVGYLARAWDAWLSDHPGAKRVPPVIPIVLFYGEGPWSAPTSITASLDATPELIATAGPYLPAWSFVLDDLHSTPDDDLRAREVGVFGRLSLLLLKHSRSVDGTDLASIGSFMRSVLDLLGALYDRGDEARSICYILDVVKDLKPARLLEALGDAATPRIKEAVMTGGELLRLEGEARGILAGQRRSLLRLLRARFGGVSTGVEARVAGADQKQLDAWLDAAATASRIEDVWNST